MLSFLFAIVRRGSRTIETQQNTLHDRISQLSGLLAQNESLRQRIDELYVRSAETHEAFLRRVGHELHDGPAQLIALALLRLDALQTKDRPGTTPKRRTMRASEARSWMLWPISATSRPVSSCRNSRRSRRPRFFGSPPAITRAHRDARTLRGGQSASEALAASQVLPLSIHPVGSQQCVSARGRHGPGRERNTSQWDGRDCRVRCRARFPSRRQNGQRRPSRPHQHARPRFFAGRNVRPLFGTGCGHPPTARFEVTDDAR